MNTLFQMGYFSVVAESEQVADCQGCPCDLASPARVYYLSCQIRLMGSPKSS